MIRRILSWVLTVCLLLAIWQYQAISDWWVLRNYQPSNEIAALVDKTAMTEEGEKLFYLGTPEINNKTTFSNNCPVVERQVSLVLGCYYGGDIFILRVSKPQLRAVMPVTAAHEMLHVAFLRLDDSSRNKIEKQIKSFYPKIKNSDFRKLIAEYKASEPGELINELHALLPTQISKLPSQLETYYQKYFTDRSKVVELFNKYRGVFEELTRQRQQLIAEINNLRIQIQQLESQAQSAADEANALAEQINQLRTEGQFEESNQLVPAQNAAAERAKSLTAERNSLAELYNQKVARVNELALISQDLVDSLDASVRSPAGQ